MNLLPANHHSERLNVTGGIDQGRLDLSRARFMSGLICSFLFACAGASLRSIGALGRPSGEPEIMCDATDHLGVVITDDSKFSDILRRSDIHTGGLATPPTFSSDFFCVARPSWQIISDSGRFGTRRAMVSTIVVQYNYQP